MSTDKKLYTIAGTSFYKGETSVRVATGKISVREGVLRRNEHTDIKLFELPTPMTRTDAATYIGTLDGNFPLPAPKVKAEKAPKAPKVKAEKAPKAPKVKAEKAPKAPKAEKAPVIEVVPEVVTAELTAEDKLAARRARDAARKRELRAAAKATREEVAA